MSIIIIIWLTCRDQSINATIQYIWMSLYQRYIEKIEQVWDEQQQQCKEFWTFF